MTIPGHSRPLPVLPQTPPTQPDRDQPPAETLPEPVTWGPARCLITATAMAGVLGVPVGLLLGYWSGAGQMASVPWAGLVQAHGQLQLYGWIGLAVLGVTFHAMSNLFRTEEPPAVLAHAVLWFQAVGVVLRLAAPLVPGASGAAGAGLLLLSALSLLAAFGITLEAHARTLPRRAPGNRAPTVLPRFLLVGLALWLTALLVNLDGAIEAVRFGPAAAGAISTGRDAFIVAATSGGLAMIAAGMSLRVVVGWLDLPAPDLARAGQAWWLLTGGVLLRTVEPLVTAGGLTGAATGVGVAGAILWAAGVFWHLPVLRGLWTPDAVRQGGGRTGESDPPLAWYVRSAYAWFAATGVLAMAQAAMALAEANGQLGLAGVFSSTALADSGRHALLFGFLGLLTAGLSGRLPSAFLDIGEAPVRASQPFYRAAWLLLLVASVLRVFAPLLGALRTESIVLSGALGAVGLWCLLVVLWRIAAAARRRERTLARLARTAGTA